MQAEKRTPQRWLETETLGCGNERPSWMSLAVFPFPFPAFPQAAGTGDKGRENVMKTIRPRKDGRASGDQPQTNGRASESIFVISA